MVSSLQQCLFLFILCVIGGSYAATCPCQNATWCQPITAVPKREVFLFSVSNKNWKLYDWTKVTTVVQFGYIDPDLMCYAHSKGARVVVEANFPEANLTSPSARSLWIAKQVQIVKDNFLDGINIDFEHVIPAANKSARAGLTALVQGASIEIKKFVKGAQVTMDVAWSPDCIDERCYDYKGLSQVADFLFVMSYDERSQIRGPCIAWANSAYNNTVSGLKKYLALGIPAKKLVLGLPWYGYDYPCLNISKGNVCSIKKVPFVGVNCSDAAGHEINYSIIVENLLKISTTGRIWEKAAKSPFFNYKDKKTGQLHQVWYDDPDSLSIKYSYARKFGLRGVGMWQVDALDYSSTKEAKKQREAMWKIL